MVQQSTWYGDSRVANRSHHPSIIIEALVPQPSPAMNVKGNEDAVAATLADPQYKAGRKLIDNGRLEEAVNFFGGLLETRVAVHDGDEMNPALAPLYYEYGNSLLYNAEESGAIFGDAVTEAEKKRAMAIVEAQITGATGNVGGVDEDVNDGGAGADLADEEEAPSPDQGTEEDLEVAWENLEMARRIYSELELKDEIRAAIAKVKLLLSVCCAGTTAQLYCSYVHHL